MLKPISEAPPHILVYSVIKPSRVKSAKDLEVNVKEKT